MRSCVAAVRGAVRADLVIVDECLSVQNDTALQTGEAWRHAGLRGSLGPVPLHPREVSDLSGDNLPGGGGGMDGV